MFDAEINELSEELPILVPPSVIMEKPGEHL